MEIRSRFLLLSSLHSSSDLYRFFLGLDTSIDDPRPSSSFLRKLRLSLCTKKKKTIRETFACPGTHAHPTICVTFNHYLHSSRLHFSCAAQKCPKFIRILRDWKVRNHHLVSPDLCQSCFPLFLSHYNAINIFMRLLCRMTVSSVCVVLTEIDRKS